MLGFTLLFLIVCGINKGIAEDNVCKTENTCDCCNSNPTNGSRELSDICNSQLRYWNCTYGCKDGYWGWKCFNYCPPSCISCHSNYRYNQICYLCADGYYNGTGVTNCSTPCPSNCAENLCDKTSGNCLQGCTSNNWSGDKCNDCADTWFGNNCDIECPRICKDKVCDENGDCTTGCAHENFAGDRCEMCKTNYYGINCDKSCQNCLNGICDQLTGLCNDCDVGSFGDFCDKPCSLGCKNSVCDRYDGICPEGCNHGFSGDKCCLLNNNCEKCDSTSTCTQCTPGHYGDSCSLDCPQNCYGGCVKDSGGCFLCVNGYYGPTCNNTCPANCVNGICDRKDGICIKCIPGYFGRSCNLECSLICKDNLCDQDTGSCKLGCVNEEENDCEQSTVTPDMLERQTMIMIGALVGGLILILIIVQVQWYILRRLSRRKSTEQNYMTPYRSRPDGENDEGTYDNPDLYNDGEL